MPAWQYNAESNISCCLISHNGASILLEQGLVGCCPANVEDAYWVHLVLLVVIVHRPTSMTGLMSSAGNGVGVSWESSLRLRLKLESVLLLRKHPSVWHRLSHCSFDWFLSVCHSTFTVQWQGTLCWGLLHWSLCGSQLVIVLSLKLINKFSRLGNAFWKPVWTPEYGFISWPMCDDVLFVGFALLLTIAQILIPNSSGWLVHQEGFVEVLFLAHSPCGKFVLVFFAYWLHELLSISFSSCLVNTDGNNLGEQCSNMGSTTDNWHFFDEYLFILGNSLGSFRISTIEE